LKGCGAVIIPEEKNESPKRLLGWKVRTNRSYENPKEAKVSKITYYET